MKDENITPRPGSEHTLRLLSRTTAVSGITTVFTAVTQGRQQYGELHTALLCLLFNCVCGCRPFAAGAMLLVLNRISRHSSSSMVLPCRLVPHERSIREGTSCVQRRLLRLAHQCHAHVTCAVLSVCCCCAHTIYMVHPRFLSLFGKPLGLSPFLFSPRKDGRDQVNSNGGQGYPQAVKFKSTHHLPPMTHGVNFCVQEF